MALSKSFGIAKGWPLASGRPLFSVVPTVPEFSPASIPDLLRSFDFDGATQANLASIPAANGTTGDLTLSGGVDRIAALTPNGKGMLRTTRADSPSGAFPATADLAAFTFCFLLAPSDASSTNSPTNLLSRSDSTTRSYIQLHYSSTEDRYYRLQRCANTGGSAASNLSISTGVKYGAAVIAVLRYTGAALELWIDGVLDASIATSGTFRFDRLFSFNGTFGDDLWAFADLYGRSLTDAEIATYVAGRDAYRSKGVVWISPTGSDSAGVGFGFSKATAWATPEKAYGALLNASKVKMAAGVYTGSSLAHVRPNITFEADGGHVWLDGCAPYAGVWTNVAPDTYDTPWSVYSPAILWARENTAGLGIGGINEGREYIGYAAAADDAAVDATPRRFFYNATTGKLRVHMPAGLVPGVVEMRIAAQVQKKGYDSQQSGCAVLGQSMNAMVRWRFYGGEGCRPVTQAVHLQYVESSYNANDGFAMNTSAAGTVLEDFFAYGNGVTAIRGSGAIDGLTSHAAAQGTARRGRIMYNAMGGVRSEQYTAWAHSAHYIEGNGNDYIVLALNSSGVSDRAATNTADNLDIVVTDNSATGYAVQVEAGVNNLVTLNVTNSRFVDKRSAAAVVAIKSSGGTVTQSGNTQTDFLAMAA